MPLDLFGYSSHQWPARGVCALPPPDDRTQSARISPARGGHQGSAARWAWDEFDHPRFLSPRGEPSRVGTSLRRVSTAHNDFFADLAAQYIEATLECRSSGGAEGRALMICGYELGGRLLAVEVKCVVDQDFRQLDGEIAKSEYVHINRLKRLWDARLHSAANVKSVRKDFPDLLISLEDIGSGDGSARGNGRRSSPLADHSWPLGSEH